MFRLRILGFPFLVLLLAIVLLLWRTGPWGEGGRWGLLIVAIGRSRLGPRSERGEGPADSRGLALLDRPVSPGGGDVPSRTSADKALLAARGTVRRGSRRAHRRDGALRGTRRGRRPVTIVDAVKIGMPQSRTIVLSESPQYAIACPFGPFLPP